MDDDTFLNFPEFLELHRSSRISSDQVLVKSMYSLLGCPGEEDLVRALVQFKFKCLSASKC